MLAQANIVTTIVPTRVVVERIGIVMLGLDTFSEEPASTTITPQMTVERLFNATVSRVKWASTLIVVAGAVKELARRVQCVQPTTFVKIASDCPRANVRYVKGTVDLGITVRTANTSIREHALLARNALTLHTSAHSALEPAPESALSVPTATT